MPQSKTATTQQSISPEGLEQLISSPSGLMIGALAVITIASIFGKKKNTAMAQSYWGGSQHLKAAEILAKQQIRFFSGATHMGAVPSAAYICKPPQIAQAQGQAKKFWGLFSKPKTFWVPSLQQSCIVYGGAGLGKTFSVINPIIRSVIDQQKASIVLFDFKYPEQTAEIAGYAQMLGYKVELFAPSFLESGCLNIIDAFVTDSGDSIGAAQVASTLVENFKKSSKNSDNEFFAVGGISLIAAAIQLSKWLAEDEQAIRLTREIWGTPEGEETPLICDFLTVASLLNINSLGHRMLYARERLGPWVNQGFAQLANLASTSSQTQASSTEGSLIATAQNNINQLVKRAFVPSISGKSTISTQLDGPTLTIFGLNQDFRHIVSPLLAAGLDVLISRNIAHSRKRSAPLLFACDEAAALHLKRLANWAAESRSAGYCGVVGYQSPSQVEEQYGKDRARTIDSNHASKFFLNPQGESAAGEYSKYLGDEEITYYTSSTNSGKNGGGRSRTEHRAKRALMEPSAFLRMVPGQAIFISPGHFDKRQNQAYIPVKIEVKFPKEEIDAVNSAKPLWKAFRQEKIVSKISESLGKTKEQKDEIHSLVAEILSKKTILEEKLQANASLESDHVFMTKLDQARYGWNCAQEKYEIHRDVSLTIEFERRKKLLEFLFPPPPQKDSPKIAPDVFLKHLENNGWQITDSPPVKPEIAVLSIWMKDKKIALPGNQTGLETLAVALASIGYKVKKNT